MPPTSVHFNGSVRLPDTETVMREIAGRIPAAALTQITDGETGDRKDWVFFQSRLLEATGQFVSAVGAPDGPGDDYGATRRVHLVDGLDAADVVWPDLRYAAAYVDSFAVFERLRAEGVIPAEVRMQLQYPTPRAGLSFVDPTALDALLPGYWNALFADLAGAMRALPHEQIAVQFDVAVEIGMLARQVVMGSALDLSAVVPSLVDCIAQVPADVPVGLHLCYGDLGHRHFLDPTSMEVQVGLLDALIAASPRPIDSVSLTVPQGRADPAFFAPLADLAAPASVALSFGIVPYHPAQQAVGETAIQIRLIDENLARSAAGPRPWAISTECGMGRVAEADTRGLLDVHADILAGRRGSAELDD